MSCMLRVAGADLSLEELLKVNLMPDSIWEKGTPRIPSRPDGKICTRSGARYLVSDAEFTEFEQQKQDAVAYLKMNENILRDVMAVSGVEGAVLDFGIERRAVLVQCDSFPAELVRLAGNLGLDLELTQYPPSEEGDSEAVTNESIQGED